MDTRANAVPVELWREIVGRGANDPRPWLILPKRPCHDSENQTLSYADLFTHATGIATALHAYGGNPGDRVAIVCDNTAEAALLLLGTLLSGLVAVPVSPRTLWMPLARWTSRLSELCEDCSPRFLIGREPLPDGVVLPAVRALCFEQLRDFTPADCAASPVSPGDLALIQYTSGTTGRPRGVELTHANLFHNLAMIGVAIDVKPSDIVLTWLPLFHDMGLIGSLLSATYFHLPLVLMTPSQFVMRPESWLWAISRFRATFCAAPNSAYQACAVEVPEQKIQGLDLCSWRTAMNGAELVYASTLDAFVTRFAHYGLQSRAMCPVYGLAENTLGTAFHARGAAVAVDWVDREQLETTATAVPCDPSNRERARGVVSVGSALHGQELRIVDADDRLRVLPERAVGSVEARGPCVMRGYHRAAEASAETIAEGGWLRTGDTGYMHAGQLYLVGRSKEVINRGGRKYDAADVRLAAMDLPGIRAGIVAAFGIPNSQTGTEDLIVMAETTVRGDDERASLEVAIAFRIQQVLSIHPDKVVLVARGVIPQTSSGKIRNASARAIYVELGRRMPRQAVQAQDDAVSLELAR